MFIEAFSDELEKLAKYPISRLLTGRVPAATVGAVQGALIHPLAGAAFAGRDLLHQQLFRTVGGRALAGRLARGGKGLMKHEKKKLSEALGVSEGRLEKLIASHAKRQKGGKTYPVSRALSTKYNPLSIPRRLVDTRAMAGRAARGGKGMTKREREILAALKKEKTVSNVKRGLLAGSAMLGTAAALGK
jgi:hypothetical protein